MTPYKKRNWALHVYIIATLVVSWLKNDSKWFQMKSNDFSWFHRDPFRVISDHLESFKSWGDKIICTINMQRWLSFFVGSQTQWMGSYKRAAYEWVFTLFLIKANLEGPISVNPIWHGERGGGGGGIRRPCYFVERAVLLYSRYMASYRAMQAI